MRTLAWLWLAVITAAATSSAAIVTYEPTRDTYMRGGLTDLHGTSPFGRASKAFLDFYLSDFDRPAIINAINAELGHPFTFDDMTDIELSLNLFSNDSQGYQPTALSRPAVFQGTQDWFEGTNLTGGATKGYALYDPSDPLNNLAWRNRAGNAVNGFLNLDRVENAVFEEWGGSPFTYREWVLDDFVAFAYLTDALSLGLFLNASDQPNPGGIEAEYNNTEVYSRERTDPLQRPFLKVTVIPEPTAFALLGLSTVMALRRRRSSESQ